MLHNPIQQGPAQARWLGSQPPGTERVTNGSCCDGRMTGYRAVFCMAACASATVLQIEIRPAEHAAATAATAAASRRAGRPRA